MLLPATLLSEILLVELVGAFVFELVMLVLFSGLVVLLFVMALSLFPDLFAALVLLVVALFAFALLSLLRLVLLIAFPLLETAFVLLVFIALLLFASLLPVSFVIAVLLPLALLFELLEVMSVLLPLLLLAVLFAMALDSNCFIVELLEVIALSLSVFCFSSNLISSFNFFFSVASFVLLSSFLSKAIKSVISLLYVFKMSFCLTTSLLLVLSIAVGFTFSLYLLVIPS